MALTREQLDMIKARFYSRRSLHTQPLPKEGDKCVSCGRTAELGERHCFSCLQHIDEIDYASEVGDFS